MMSIRASWLAAFVLGLGGLWLANSAGRADDKKKPEPKAAAPLLDKSDELTEKDNKDTKRTNSPCKIYKVKLTEGKTYRIDLKSKDFDSYLRLEDAAGKEVAYNDDAPDEKTLDSRIIYKAPKTDEYKVIATNLDAKPGKFTLTVVPEVIFKATPVELAFKDGKATYSGELNNKDPMAKDPGGREHYYKIFTLKFEKGKSYQIDHRSADFDAYLFLEDPDGVTLADDDDSGGGLNSRIIHKATMTGAYRVIATTLKANDTGKFSLEVAPSDKEEEAALRLRREPVVQGAPATLRRASK